jgi:O-antigen ligase
MSWTGLGWARRIHGLIFGTLLLLLVWLPVPLGSNRAWAWGLFEVASFALLAAWVVLWATRRASIPEAVRHSWPALTVLGTWVACQALYVIPLPPGLVAFLSPESYRMHSLVNELGVTQATMTLSVDPHASLTAFLKTLAYSAVFVLVLLLVNRRSRVLLIARTLVYASVVIATYGVFLHVTGVTQHIFGMELRHGDSAIGTYVNRNHFAGYLEMTLALGIGLLIAGLSDRHANSWRQFAAQTIDWILSPKMILRLALCVLVIALTTTRSRMGNTAFFASLLVAGGIGIALSRHATRNTVILLASLIAIDLFIVGSWFGVEKLAKRVQETTAGDLEIREEPAQYALNLVRDYPVFGSGPGSFSSTFPRYRPESINNLFDYAHNDYIQTACESGLLGLGILGLFVMLTLGAALLAQWRRRDPLMRGISFACIMGLTALLIHSWVDFNLQIPANATYFMVLCALGWISLHLDRRGSDVRSQGDEE